MKILLVMPIIKYGGSNKMLCELANSFAKKSHDITILTYYSGITHQKIDDNITQKCLDIPMSNNWFYRNIAQKIPILKKIISMIRENEYDAILSFGDTSSFDLFLAKIFTKSKVVISERVDPYSNRGFMDKIRKSLYFFADGLVFQTEGAKNYFRYNVQKKSVVIPNPVINKNIPLKFTGKRNRQIVSVGRLDIFQKRQDVLLEAFAMISKEYSDIELILFGSGGDKVKLNKHAEYLGISERVTFAGVSKNIYDSIHKSLIFVLPSDFEGIPNALIEAMSVGLPVISTDCRPGGARLLIKNKENGILVPRGNARELADAMKYMINNPIKAEAMGENATNILKDYNAKSIFNEWESFIESLVFKKI